MRQSSKGEGTKIAQAAKELNVTSVTIRRYLAEFNIETTTDENGVKVLPQNSMEELSEIRRLKEEGLTNPKVLEILEERRAQGKAEKAKPAKEAKESAPKAARATKRKAQEPVEAETQEEEPEPPKKAARTTARSKAQRPAVEFKADKDEEESQENTATAASSADAPALDLEETASAADLQVAGKSKHTLTCQTCGKVFEHMNPKLRDCLDCYRIKRKERRRGGDKHKNVIQHPIAQQAATKSALPGGLTPLPEQVRPAAATQAVSRTSSVRNYRKAIEETRYITAGLKRRLERPDLSEGERRWLEQIYAYQLILHQGWRHLSDYRSQQRSES